MTAYINIKLQGTVYFASRGSSYDDDMVRLFSKILKDTDAESSLDVLFSRAARKWRQQDDVVHPFLGPRHFMVGTVWTFDLDKDTLQFDKKDQTAFIPLKLLRQGDITVSDFEPYEPPVTPTSSLPSTRIGGRPWPRRTMQRLKIPSDHLQRQYAFIGRILEDFAVQWRHVLLGRYNEFTFRRLACAIIRIVTLNFNVKKFDAPRHGTGGYLVPLASLPDWEPFSKPIVRAGGVSIVMSQHPRHAMTVIKNDFSRYFTSKIIWGREPARDVARTYLILSVREVTLYRIDGIEERCTTAERLFDGVLPPSTEAINRLLEAVYCSAPTTPLQELAPELQSIVLDNVSAGPVERARIACILNLDLPFRWKSNGRDIQKETGRRHRFSDTPVESHLCFGETLSGVAYK